MARPVRRAVRAWRWAHRNLLAAQSLTAAALAVVVGLLAVTLSWRAERHQRRQAEPSLRQTRELLAGVVGQVYDDLRLPDAGREPFPPAMAVDMLRRLGEYQASFAVSPARSRVGLAARPGGGLLLAAAGQPRDAVAVLRGQRRRGGRGGRRDWHSLALVQRGCGQADEAARLVRRAVSWPDRECRRSSGPRLHDLGRDAFRRRRLDDASRYLTDSAAAWDRVLVGDPVPGAAPTGPRSRWTWVG
ncbi:MAG: hypothetical protein U0797_14965 [Gemmataceae bacterium]